jgi:hypothetical protein
VQSRDLLKLHYLLALCSLSTDAVASDAKDDHDEADTNLSSSLAAINTQSRSRGEYLDGYDDREDA